jgi:endo-1,3(4)-beta-glucanase
MRAYKTVADEFSMREQSSQSFAKRSFKDDALDSVVFAEGQQPASGIHLEYSIENGIEVGLEMDTAPNPQKNGTSGYRSKITSMPRRRRIIIIGLAILLGIILIVSISTVASKKRNTQTTSALNSRFKDKGRGEGGGAGNGDFVQSQINNIFLGDDVRLPPFSLLDPVQDLDRFGYDRPLSSTPSARLDPLTDQTTTRALPTNAWYQNMLRLEADEEPTKDHRVYTVPYVIDAAGSFAGIRAHNTRLEATPTQVKLAIDEPYGLTLGAMADVNSGFAVDVLDKGYSVHEATDLGLTLQWDSYMKSTLVRGSPYVTMIYDMSNRVVSEGVLPTMHWKLDTSELPIVDGSRTVDCRSEPVFTVERDLELAFFNSNQRWMLFFSRPVQLQCQNVPGTPTIFQVSESESNYDDSLLIIRGALIVSSSNTADDKEVFRESYTNQLKASADVFPGQSTSIALSFNEEADSARISFDWDAQTMSAGNANQMVSRNTDEMIMFALPHHRETLAGKVSPTLCTVSMMGSACLVEGNVWNMYETLPDVDFRAARHPDPLYVPILAEALLDDVRYQIPSNFQSGAADTYFSGKTTAKLARILLVNEEIQELCASNSDYLEACDDLELSGEEEITEALNQLRESVTVWVRTNSQSPFVYDNAWGGLVSCGCLYNNGECTNVFPECPAFTDQGLNFGNGFYNDHHFHYGYHIYAAAALAHFDSAWAVEYYEDVALLVRDYANPSQEDSAFPVFRNKDWYRGHSWAGGITKPMFGNIMNQESSSEAIMAYEAVALYGKTMASIFQDEGDTNKASVAKMMHNVGLTLTATEIRSTQKYWQVRQNVEDSKKIYPGAYTGNVVGILWETFAEYTTWFGNAPYLIYGIQLLPLTPISEARDGLEWANEIYGPLSESCNGLCVKEGWSIQVNAILATIGRVEEAVENILGVPSTAYEFAGGNGHSKSNTLWYITTRPGENSPSFESEEEDEIISNNEEEFETTSSNNEEEVDTTNGNEEDKEEEIETTSGNEEDEEEFETINGDEEEFETINENEEDFEIENEDEEDFETENEGEEDFETTNEDDEGFETENKDEEDIETINGDKDESVKIEIVEEDSNPTNGDGQQPDITGENDLFFDFDEVDLIEDLIIEDKIVDENFVSEKDNVSNENNNVVDEITAGDESSFNKNNGINVDGVNVDGVDDVEDNNADNVEVDENDFADDKTADEGVSCFNPTCTDEVLDTIAEGYSCRDRIQYLMDVLGKTELDACHQLAVLEYPAQCGFCRPFP